jgi:hypothetical protein
MGGVFATPSSNLGFNTAALVPSDSKASDSTFSNIFLLSAAVYLLHELNNAYLYTLCHLFRGYLRLRGSCCSTCGVLTGELP